ncbi:unnamed protein product [Leptosia nina]|uniref:Carboxylesterase type B domain-containing protein n=1 Tax=Leptosia nina TaxID=320188 RepID=A0AAV1JN60_9NEOP
MWCRRNPRHHSGACLPTAGAGGSVPGCAVRLEAPAFGRPLEPPVLAGHASGRLLRARLSAAVPGRIQQVFAPLLRSAALSKMPLGVYREVAAIAPLLANQSEDCLYLNIYVPGSGARGVEAPYAVAVWANAAHAWGSGNALDAGAAVLAARAHLLVVTLNYRIGLLGFLTSGGDDEASRAGGAAVLDIVAALSWIRTNIAPFGGDSKRVTLVGHGTGAALLNTVVMTPGIKGLVTRILLLSGSALSPSALAPDPALAREHTAQALRCTRDQATDDHWLTACIKNRPLSVLLAVDAPTARFLAGWAPSVPKNDDIPNLSPTRAMHASDTFLDCSLAVVVTTTESYRYFSEEDIRHGFEEEYRNRVLRTYVRNVYRFHRNEIFAAIRNEYTDWEKPIQHPINIRDATLESISDAAGAAPALRVAQLHAKRGAPTYFAHFAHQSKDADYPQRLGSVTSETLPYFLGLPLVGGPPFAPKNYSRGDVGVAESCVALLAAFAKTGDPSLKPEDQETTVGWPRYELNTQQYLSIVASVDKEALQHSRGDKVSSQTSGLITSCGEPWAILKTHLPESCAIFCPFPANFVEATYFEILDKLEIMISPISSSLIEYSVMLCQTPAGTKVRTKSHYRGHKMSVWLHLIPQLHRAGAAPAHHQFRSLHPDMFAVEIGNSLNRVGTRRRGALIKHLWTRTNFQIWRNERAIRAIARDGNSRSGGILGRFNGGRRASGRPRSRAAATELNGASALASAPRAIGLGSSAAPPFCCAVRIRRAQHINAVLCYILEEIKLW